MRGKGRSCRMLHLGPRILGIVLLASFLIIAQCSSAKDVAESPGSMFDPGEGSFQFWSRGWGPHPDSPIDVWYSAPDADLRDVRILIVLPGRGRNGEEYRDDWLNEARGRELLLLVPEFPSEDYSVDEYNLGNLVADDGDPVPNKEWTFEMVEALFDQVLTDLGGAQSGYYLYGHSAGAQFVHRFMLYVEDPRVVHAVSANAGWYTVPDLSVSFPYGLRGGPPQDEAGVRRIVGTGLTILLGSEDDDPDADGLRSDEGSRRQGATRLERGRSFFRVGRRSAKELSAPFAWNLDVVDGVGHSNADMVGAAAVVLFD